MEYTDEFDRSELDEAIEEQLRERVFELQQRDHITLVNPIEYKKALIAINRVKEIIDGHLADYIPEIESDNYDEDGNFIDPSTYTAKYNEFFTGPILSHGLCFQVFIPDVGVDFSYSEIAEIVGFFDPETSISLSPDKSGNYVNLSIWFPNIHTTTYLQEES